MYSIAGFSLPYFVVGSMALFMAIILVFVVPKVKTDIKAKESKKSKSLSFAALLKARFTNGLHVCFSQALQPKFNISIINFCLD